MKFLTDIKNFKNNIAFTTNDGQNINYQSFLKNIDEQSLNFNTKFKSLIFLIGKNNYETAVLYASCIFTNHTIALLDSNLDNNLLDNLIKIYKPDFIISDRKKKILSNSFSLKNTFYNMKILKNKNSFNKNIYKDLLYLVSTSGSTGSPKFVRISHNNLDNNLFSICKFLPIDEKEVTITTLPLSYVYGLSIFNSHLTKGARIVLYENSVIEKKFLKCLEKEKITSFGGVPYIFSIIDRVHKSKIITKDLKYVTQAGGKMNEKLLKNFLEIFKKNNIKFFLMYGSAEATARMSYLDWKLTDAKFGSIGKPISGGEFYLENQNGQKIEKANTEGELIYKGKNVCLGYATNVEDLSLGDTNNGVLKTGDIAYKDKDDFYFLKGRKDRFIKIFGIRVNLIEVEQLIFHYGLENICKQIAENKIEITLAKNFDKNELINHISNKLSLHPSIFSVKKVDKLPLTKNLKYKYK